MREINKVKAGAGNKQSKSSAGKDKLMWCEKINKVKQVRCEKINKIKQVRGNKCDKCGNLNRNLLQTEGFKTTWMEGKFDWKGNSTEIKETWIKMLARL